MKILCVYYLFMQILAMDSDRKNYEMGRPILEKAGVTHKIDFREGPALPLLDQLLQDVSFNFSSEKT